MDTRAVEVSVFYIFRTMDKLISRYLVQEASHLLQLYNKKVRAAPSCPEMKAGEYLYLVSLMEMIALWRYVSFTSLLQL